MSSVAEQNVDLNLIYWSLIPEMSESDLLASDHIDGLDGLENGQDGDAIMQCDGVKREINEANVDDPVSHDLFLTSRSY